VVLDEIDDLMSCNGKEVEVALDEKSKVVVYTPHNRKLKARIVEASNCPSS
jgi:serine protease inhibitor ecotin